MGKASSLKNFSKLEGRTFKFVCLLMLLSLIMLLGISPHQAYAEAISDSPVFVAADNSSFEQFKARVYNALLDRETSIDVSDIGITNADITYIDTNGNTQIGEDALVLMVRSHPLFSTLCVGYGGFSFTYTDDVIATVNVTYTYNGALWSEGLLANFKSKYADFISGTKSPMTDVQKAAYVHDWLCANTTYSLNANLADFGIAAIANGRAVCGGYAQAYQFLANQLDLECKYVSGTTSAGSHAWNKIKVDGQWFYVDCTWDRSLSSSTTFTHTYFLLNDTEFSQTSGHSSDSNVANNEPQNTTYYFANKYWNEVRGPLSEEELAQDPKLTDSSDSSDNKPTTPSTPDPNPATPNTPDPQPETPDPEPTTPEPVPTPEPTPEPEPKPTVETVTMYRLYNPYSGEHLYTSSTNEYNTLGTIGWIREGKAWTAPKSSNTPVYRLYNPYSGDHHYTTSFNEYTTLGTIGWKKEGIAWYSSDTRDIPVYRLFNPNATIGTHHYTTSSNEYNTLGTIGWIKEGIAWYGVAS